MLCYVNKKEGTEMKRFLAALLTLAMVLSLAACGGDDPHAGIYEAVSCSALGYSLDCEGDLLELKGNGRGKLHLMGDEFNCSWTLEEESFTLKNHGDEFFGTLHNGIITLDFGDMVYVYLMQPVEDEEGNIRGHVHVWQEADCENSKFCIDCGLVDAEPLGHDAQKAANYQDASLCSRCGITLEEKLQPDMEKYGICEFMEIGVIYPYTTVTYKNPEKETTGELQLLSYETFDSREGYPEREGYEWRVATFQADFFDPNAVSWGIHVGLCYEDYYNIELSDDTAVYDEETQINNRTVNFHGQDMTVYHTSVGSWEGWNREHNNRYQNRYTLTHYWQVPKGYDGCILGFYNECTISWDDHHIYEIYDPADFLLFRFN